MHLSQLVRDTAAFALEVTPPWHCALLPLWLKRLPEHGPPMSILLYIFFVLVSKIKVWWKFVIKYLQRGTGTRGLKYKFHLKYSLWSRFLCDQDVHLQRGTGTRGWADPARFESFTSPLFSSSSAMSFIWELKNKVWLVNIWICIVLRWDVASKGRPQLPQVLFKWNSAK